MKREARLVGVLALLLSAPLSAQLQEVRQTIFGMD